MSPEEKEMLEAVEELNQIFFDVENDTANTWGLLLTGSFQAVMLNEEILWHSENDTREYREATDDYEPFLPFIKRIFNEYVDGLTKFKFKI